MLHGNSNPVLAENDCPYDGLEFELAYGSTLVIVPNHYFVGRVLGDGAPTDQSEYVGAKQHGRQCHTPRLEVPLMLHSVGEEVKRESV